MTIHAFDSAHLQAVARQNPKRVNEHPLCYLQRLCVLAGLIKPEDTSGAPPDGWHNAAELEEKWFQK